MSPENFHYLEQHPALKARERLVAELKARYEQGDALPSGEAIGGKMVTDAIEERYALDSMLTAYCYIHNHRYAARGACCYCVNGVPMAPAHTDDIRQMQKNAQREIDWQVRREALNGAKRQKGLAEGEKPLRMGRLRGGWLRQQRLERMREQEISLAMMLFGTIVALILLAAVARIGFFAGRADAILEPIVREVR